PGDWARQLWGWLESIRRASNLLPAEKLVAHVLALDFANHESARCDPSLAEIERVIGMSRATVKRSLLALESAGWIVRSSGCGRGRSTGYGFLSRARVVALRQPAPRGGNGVASDPDYTAGKGVTGEPSKGVTGEPPDHPKGGHRRPERGSRVSHPYYIDKPYKNHKGREGAVERSQNPYVAREAEDAVKRFRDGRHDALADLKPWVISHIVAADLLTSEERQRAGIF
ncbi:MAG: hypothetical protein GYB53_15020, partial [Rhodobacteraceae bacterium]|nr:hypothetical protein [Paracoccaceae bacterium]